MLEINGNFWLYGLLAVFVALLSGLIRSYRYKVILSFYNAKPSFLSCIWINYSSMLINYLAPLKIGLIIGKPTSTKYFSNTTMKIGFLATFFEQMQELGWQLLILPILFLFYGLNKITGAFLFNLFLLIILLIIFVFSLIYYKKIISFLWKFKGIMPKKFKKLAVKYNMNQEEIFDLLQEARASLHNFKLIFKTSIFTWLIILLIPFILQFTGLIFDINISYFDSFIITWIASVLGKLSGLPGGIGVRDASLGALLIGLGLDFDVAIKIALLHRLFVTLLYIVIGGPGVFFLSRKIKDSFKK